MTSKVFRIMIVHMKSLLNISSYHCSTVIVVPTGNLTEVSLAARTLTRWLALGSVRKTTHSSDTTLKAVEDGIPQQTLSTLVTKPLLLADYRGRGKAGEEARSSLMPRGHSLLWVPQEQQSVIQYL